MLKFALFTAAAAAIAVTAMPSSASAKSCAPNYVVAQGLERLTMAGARVSARRTWRAAAKAAYGDKWDTWARAENRSVDCAPYATTRSCLAVGTPCAR